MATATVMGTTDMEAGTAATRIDQRARHLM
jgi:hypothetical protein